MKVKIGIFTALFVVLLLQRLSAQIQYGGSPTVSDSLSRANIPILELNCEKPDKSLIKKSDPASRLKISNDFFVCDVNLSYKDMGLWDTLKEGTKTWRMGFYAKDAASLSVVFSKFKLAKGVRIFVYDQQQQQIRGGFTYKNNKSYGSLAISPVQSNRIYIEAQLMKFVNDPGDIEIGYIAKRNKTAQKADVYKDGYYGSSGSCNIDINCHEEPEIQKIKHSVVRIVYMGSERCTGTLINNTSEDATPYVLTAQHCISSQYIASTCIFYFNYESPYCDGPDGSIQQSISGSDLIATTDVKLDFSLLKLSTSPPFYYHPIFSGWDRRNVTPQNTYSIHHPQGDVKKIAIDDHEAETGDFGEGYDANTHWLVLDWEEGTTERGSSGAPLFNQDNNLIGSLSGGDAICGYSVNDFFEKLYHSWDDYPNSENQLKPWLDTSKTGAEVLGSYDPYETLWQSGDTLSNITEGDTSMLYPNTQWGYFSGHSNDYVTLFAEHFNTSSNKNIMGVFFNVGKAVASSDTSHIKLIIWKGEQQPGEIVFFKNILLLDLIEDEINLINLDTVVPVENSFFIGYEICYSLPGDTFAVNMNVNERIGSENTAYVFSDSQWLPMNEYIPSIYNISLDIQPIVYDSVPLVIRPDTVLPEGEILIYPNPVTTNKVGILFWERPENDIQINLFDLNGQLISSKVHTQPDIVIEYYVGDILPGIYFIQVNISKFIIITKKIVVLDK